MQTLKRKEAKQAKEAMLANEERPTKQTHICVSEAS